MSALTGRSSAVTVDTGQPGGNILGPPETSSKLEEIFFHMGEIL
jgi:hypothetical protein